MNLKQNIKNLANEYRPGIEKVAFAAGVFSLVGLCITLIHRGIVTESYNSGWRDGVDHGVDLSRGLNELLALELGEAQSEIRAYEQKD